MRRWRDKVRLRTPALALEFARAELWNRPMVEIKLLNPYEKMGRRGWAIRFRLGPRKALAWCSPRSLPWQFRERVRRAVEAL
jgi:hypothetical protein